MENSTLLSTDMKSRRLRSQTSTQRRAGEGFFLSLSDVHPVNASASQRRQISGNVGQRGKAPLLAAENDDRRRERGSESVGGRNVERGNEGGRGRGVAGGEFRISRAEKGTERSKGESDKRRPHVELLSVQGDDRFLPHTPRVVPQNVCSLSCASASEVQTTWRKSSPLRPSMPGAGEGEQRTNFVAKIDAESSLSDEFDC